MKKLRIISALLVIAMCLPMITSCDLSKNDAANTDTESETEIVEISDSPWEIARNTNDYGEETGSAYIRGTFTARFDPVKGESSTGTCYIFIFPDNNTVSIKVKNKYEKLIEFDSETEIKAGPNAYRDKTSYTPNFDVYMFSRSEGDQMNIDSQILKNDIINNDSYYLDIYYGYYTLDKCSIKITNVGLASLIQQLS